MMLSIKRLSFRISSTIVVLITMSLHAGAQVVNLDSALASVEANNPMLKEYDSRAKAMNSYAEGAGSWMPPMVGGGTFMMPYRREAMMDAGDRGAWMFSMEQQIPNPAKLRAKKNYLQSRAEVENLNRSVAFNELRAETRQSYYRWVVGAKKVSVLKENVEIMKLMLELARIRYPYNQGTLGSIYKIEARIEELQNMLLMTHGEIDEASFRLKSLMNLPAMDSIAIDTSTVTSFDLRRVSRDTAMLSQSRSDLRRIDETIEVMRLNQKLQSSEAKPDLRLRFDHMRPLANMPSQFSAMAMITIPIAPWSSKMYKAEVKGMRYEIQAMEQARKGIVTEARGMIAGMASQLARMNQQLENYREKIIPSLRRNYQTVMLAYEENREQLPAVIDAWESLNMIQMEYLEKLQEYYTMITNYEKELDQ